MSTITTLTTLTMSEAINRALREALDRPEPMMLIGQDIGPYGGAFGVTVLTLCGRPIHQAVATASGFGAAIAVPAAIMYIIAGWAKPDLPPFSLGYISAPGFVVLAALTALTAPMGLEDVPVVIVELTGEIAGDAIEALERLEAGRHQGSGRLVISCAKLIRVDFSAAGSILNWVASREEEGCNVQFREVHRLVGAFFNVIGINEHARVVLRSN